MLVKLVSIIVPCYSQAQYLEEALQSVLTKRVQTGNVMYYCEPL